MSKLAFLSSLNLFTLIVIFAIGTALLIMFLRKRSNRHPLEGRQERNVGTDLDAGRRAPDHNPRA